MFEKYFSYEDFIFLHFFNNDQITKNFQSGDFNQLIVVLWIGLYPISLNKILIIVIFFIRFYVDQSCFKLPQQSLMVYEYSILQNVEVASPCGTRFQQIF